MKERWLLLLNILLFVFATLLATTIQTSLWFQILGSFPAPAFWIPTVIYLSLRRSVVEAALITYLLAVALTTMTVMPLNIFMFSGLLLIVTTRAFKQRIFWEGSSYFMMVCGIASFAFHIFCMILSVMSDDRPLPAMPISDWLIEALLTPLIAPFLFRLFHGIDKITERKQPVEASAQIL